MRTCSARNFKSRFAGTFFLATFLAFSCSSNAPSISNNEKEAFVNTYVDLTLIKLGNKSAGKNLSRAEDQIFIKYGTSKEFLEEFARKMSSNPALQAQIYEEISRKLKAFNEMPVDSIDKIIRSYTAPDKEK